MRLIVLRGPEAVGPFELGPGANHAGRGAECEVLLPSKRVSRRHAVFEVIGGRVEVRDLESQNGILSADGTRVSRLFLSPGERVQVGDYVLGLEGPLPAPSAPVPPPAALPALPFGPPVGGFTTSRPPGGSPSHASKPPPPPPPPRLPVPSAPVARAPVVSPAVSPAPPPSAQPPRLPPPSAPRETLAPPSPGPAPRLAVAPPPAPDREPLPRVSGIPWLAQAAVLVLSVLAVVSCGNLLNTLARADAVQEVSLLRGVALAESLANRNTQAMADQRGISLDTAFLLEREGIGSATIVDPRGTVRAPAERLNTSVNTSAAWQDVSKTGEPAVSPLEDGRYEIAVPMRGQPGGTGPRQIVGYALVTYDPAGVGGGSVWMGVATSALVGGVVLGLLVVGAWWLLLRPLAALREETELALLGDTQNVSSPVRLAQLEMLAHTINRVLIRARTGAGSRPR